MCHSRICFFGKKDTVVIKVNHFCAVCDGFGTMDKTSPANCTDCKGMGKIAKMQQVGPGMVQQVLTECKVCDGKGSKIKPDNRCTKCKEGLVPKETNVEIEIEAGMMNGQKFMFEGEGHYNSHNRSLRGDIVVVLSEANHPTFQRQEQVPCNLVFEKKITLLQSLIGFEFEFTHVSGKRMVFKSPKNEYFTTGSLAVLPGQGMPLLRKSAFGDLFVNFQIIPPSSEEVVALRTPKSISLLTGIFDSRETKEETSKKPAKKRAKILSTSSSTSTSSATDLPTPEVLVWDQPTITKKCREKLKLLSAEDDDDDNDDNNNNSHGHHTSHQQAQCPVQ